MEQPIQPPPPPMGATTPQAVSTADSSSISNEELIEAIIDEKWNELVKDINKIIDWKTSAEGRISAMEQEVKDLKDSFDKLHQAVVGKVGEYDQHILDVGSELKAMEKVFAKILPVFTENVSALTRITDDLKGLKK